MAVTYGFYNSINKDRAYNAIQMSQIFDGIINDGIYMSVLDHFAVRASGGMNVIVGGGRAWFNHTWTYNDSDLILTIDDSEFEAKRIDAIVLKVDRRDASRKNDIMVIKGTPSDSPVKPTFDDGGDIYYHPLAYVSIDANITQVTDSMIENAIGVDERTPFVTGIIEHVTAGELLEQWVAEYQEWTNAEKEAFDEWVSTMESDATNWKNQHQQSYNTWIETQESAFETWSASEKSTYESWEAAQKEAFEEWFTGIRDILDGDIAGHLQNEIDEINEREYKRYYNICTKQTSISYDDYGDISSILSEGEGVSAITTFSTNEETQTIITRVTNGIDTYVETVTINNGNIVENYTKM